METRNKLWIGLGVVCVAGAGVYLGTADDKSLESEHVMESMVGEGGEGGEGASAEEAITSDAAYLTHLGLIRGHLNVGVNLYRDGSHDAAATHMKHPESELYADLLPALEAREAPGFDAELAALAEAVETRRPLAEVETAYESLLASISRAEATVDNPAPGLLAQVIVSLVRTAAEEYDIAVGEEGGLENAHEYQDALGFVRVARDTLGQLAPRTENAGAVSTIREQLDSIAPAWPGILPPAQLDVDPSVIYSAASRIEIAALSL